LKYGPVVRIAPNELSYITFDAWKDIYSHKAGGKEIFKKDFAFYSDDPFATPEDAGGLLRCDEVSHAMQRRLCSAAFSEKSMRDQQPLLRSYVD
jgi:cytochrome P450